MPRYSAIITAFVSRINAHCATGQILEGINFADVPTMEVKGQKDFPDIRMWMPDITESTHDQLTIVKDGTFKVKFVVATLRTAGVAAHVLVLEKFMDALELSGATIDLLLGNLLAKPMSISAGEAFVPDNGGAVGLSMNTHVTVTCVPVACKSGARRS